MAREHARIGVVAAADAGSDVNLHGLAAVEVSRRLGVGVQSWAQRERGKSPISRTDPAHVTSFICCQVNCPSRHIAYGGDLAMRRGVSERRLLCGRALCGLPLCDLAPSCLPPWVALAAPSSRRWRLH